MKKNMIISGDTMNNKTINTQRQVTWVIILIFLIITTTVGGFFWIRYEIDKKNNNNNNNNQQEIEKEKAREVKRVKLINEASLLVSGYYYQEAIDLLKSDPDIYNDKMKSEVKEIEDFVAELKPYTGRIEQVFFHSLIVYPELAFGPTSSEPQGYNYWMTTELEFQRMLPLLMERGYVLVAISDLYDVDAQGNVTAKALYSA
jgi:flagellar basal body-associated protein FliL